jgi:acetyl-CoA C-acetyltransferase
MNVVVAGGLESVSMIRTPQMRFEPDPDVLAMHDDVHMPVVETAETVARRYGIDRASQDAMRFDPSVAPPQRRPSAPSMTRS